ncbi:MAG TPA: hypothetical protein VFE53_14655 [Mucilaginibacter sp.]|jgi:hypothetical protein|nr:hypothetical protein [Mucilaginibacter sp.]
MKRALLIKGIFLALLVTSQLCAKAQNLEEDTVKRDSTIVPAERPRTVFLEVGGPGLALTANYDTRFGNQRDKWGYRVGAGYYNTGANWVATIPLQLNYLYSLGKSGGSKFAESSYLELGIGTTFMRSQGSQNGTTFQFDDDTGFFGTATIGYRYEQQDGGINFRIGFVPTISAYGFIPIGGLSVGYTF